MIENNAIASLTIQERIDLQKTAPCFFTYNPEFIAENTMKKANEALQSSIDSGDFRAALEATPVYSSLLPQEEQQYTDKANKALQDFLSTNKGKDSLAASAHYHDGIKDIAEDYKSTIQLDYTISAIQTIKDSYAALGTPLDTPESSQKMELEKMLSVNIDDAAFTEAKIVSYSDTKAKIVSDYNLKRGRNKDAEKIRDVLGLVCFNKCLDGSNINAKDAQEILKPYIGRIFDDKTMEELKAKSVSEHEKIDKKTKELGVYKNNNSQKIKAGDSAFYFQDYLNDGGCRNGTKDFCYFAGLQNSKERNDSEPLENPEDIKKWAKKYSEQEQSRYNDTCRHLERLSKGNFSSEQKEECERDLSSMKSKGVSGLRGSNYVPQAQENRGEKEIFFEKAANAVEQRASDETLKQSHTQSALNQKN